MPIHKFKKISNCPNQGSLSVAFTNASVLGRCYIVRSQPAASVAVCACAWEKKNKINLKKRQQTRKHPTNPPACGQKCRGDPDCFRKDFTRCAKGYAAGGSGAAGGSNKALRQDGLRSTDTATRPAPSRHPRASTRSHRPAPASAAGVTVPVRGELSANLPAVLNYLNVPKFVHIQCTQVYIAPKNLWFTDLQPIYMYVFVYIHTRVCVCMCVYVYRYTHKHKRVYICFLSILET